jgi:hypothetical protein
MLRLDSPSFWKDYRPENGGTRGPRGPPPAGSPALPAPLFSRGRRGPIPASTPGRRLLDSPGRPTRPAPGTAIDKDASCAIGPTRFATPLVKVLK